MKQLIEEIEGKTVRSAEYDEDSHADPRVTITFEDGTTFVVSETRQCGWIEYWTGPGA